MMMALVADALSRRPGCARQQQHEPQKSGIVVSASRPPVHAVPQPALRSACKARASRDRDGPRAARGSGGSSGVGSATAWTVPTALVPADLTPVRRRWWLREAWRGRQRRSLHRGCEMDAFLAVLVRLTARGTVRPLGLLWVWR